PPPAGGNRRTRSSTRPRRAVARAAPAPPRTECRVWEGPPEGEGIPRGVDVASLGLRGATRLSAAKGRDAKTARALPKKKAQVRLTGPRRRANLSEEFRAKAPRAQRPSQERVRSLRSWRLCAKPCHASRSAVGDGTRRSTGPKEKPTGRGPWALLCS